MCIRQINFNVFLVLKWSTNFKKYFMYVRFNDVLDLSQ